MKGGNNRQIRFSNNTKKTTNTNNTINYAKIPNSYLSNLQARIPEPNPVHEENAHLFAKVSQRSTPEKMAKDLYYLYNPTPLSTGDYTRMIELVGNSGMPGWQKERIIQHLRYERAMAKVKKTFVD